MNGLKNDTVTDTSTTAEHKKKIITNMIITPGLLLQYEILPFFLLKEGHPEGNPWMSYEIPPPLWE